MKIDRHKAGTSRALRLSPGGKRPMSVHSLHKSWSAVPSRSPGRDPGHGLPPVGRAQGMGLPSHARNSRDLRLMCCPYSPCGPSQGWVNRVLLLCLWGISSCCIECTALGATHMRASESCAPLGLDVAFICL